ncbi:cell division protein FtsB [Candidatus Fukatsuia anoeciicola]|uniref:cell division protein FtsB n=1 Tax=Candidatus Fukatsuia anoeciicola TaxID=2994492 RepID=UPI0034638F6A
MGKLIMILLILFSWLQYSLWFGKNGIHDFFYIKNYILAQEINNHKLKVRNDQLFTEINDLNIGQEAIEERARNELGMIKPNESFYRLVPEQSKNKIKQNNKK